MRFLFASKQSLSLTVRKSSSSFFEHICAEELESRESRDQHEEGLSAWTPSAYYVNHDAVCAINSNGFHASKSEDSAAKCDAFLCKMGDAP